MKKQKRKIITISAMMVDKVDNSIEMLNIL